MHATITQKVITILGLVLGTPCARGESPVAEIQDKLDLASQEETEQRSGSDQGPEFRVPYAVWRRAQSVYEFTVAAKSETMLTIRLVNSNAREWGISEGYYLAIALPNGAKREQLEKPIATRAQVHSISLPRGIDLSVPLEAAKQIQKGQRLLLLRPPGATTKEMRRVPGIAQVKYIDLLSTLSAEMRESVIMAGRLQEIGKLLHEYHELHGNFPPAVVYGPDGKPWHSWRILLMGLGRYKPIFNRYRFNEPWDSRHNRQFVELCPKLFRYPDDELGHTAFAVVTGDKTAFPAQGAQFDGDEDRLGAIYGSTDSATSRDDIEDGWSNTILVGTIDKTRKVPWTKPEELKFTREFSGFDRDGGFAAPFRADPGRFGLFLLADGGVIGLRDSVERSALVSMCTIDGAEAPTPLLPKVAVSKRIPDRIIIRFELNRDRVPVCVIEEVDDV